MKELMLESFVTPALLSTPRAIGGEQRKAQKRKSLWRKGETPGGPPVKGVSRGQGVSRGVSRPAARKARPAGRSGGSARDRVWKVKAPLHPHCRDAPRGVSEAEKRACLPQSTRGTSGITGRITPPQRRPAGRLYSGTALSRYSLRSASPGSGFNPRHRPRRSTCS